MPQEKLSAAEVSRGMRLSIFDGLLTQSFYGMTWPGSIFISSFALILGATNFQVGLIAGFGPLLSFAYLLGAPLLERSKSRKGFFATYSTIHRVVFLLLLILPFLAADIGSNIKVSILLGVIAVSVFFGNFQGTAWMSWMSDMVPEDRRGAFFSRRNMICGGLWIVVSFTLGKVLTAHNSVWGYTIAFVSVTALALFSVPVVVSQPDPGMMLTEKRQSLFSLWKTISQSKSFKNFLLFQILWGFFTNLAGPFYNVYMLQSLHIDLARITIWGIVWQLISLVTTPYWGVLSDRAGNKPTLLFCLIGSCLAAFGWLFLTPENAQWGLFILFALGGIFDTGIGLVSFNMLLGILPEKNKPSFLGIFETIVGTFAGLAPVVGGLLASSTFAFSLPLGPMHITFNSVLIVIAISTVLRIIPLMFISAMPSQFGMGFMVKEFVLANPFKLFTSLYLSHKSPNQKLDAIDNLSQMKSRAALPELIKSMRDLDPRVRERAVRALGTIGDPQAVPALISALDDPLFDIQGEAALALGSLGDKRAAGPLLKLVKSPDLHLQRCAISSLGKLGSTEAVESLCGLMKETGNVSVLLACADALGRIRDFYTIETMLDVTRLSRNTAVKSNLVASTGLLVDRNGELYRILSQPELHTPRALSEILNRRVIRIAQHGQGSVLQNIKNAQQAALEKKYNEAILEMKVINQITVREYLAQKELKDLLGFEKWVKLLDSDFGTQLSAINALDHDTGIALGLVDYYARHCPLSAEPDMDEQEFLLALYAFKEGQLGLSEALFGRPMFHETVRDALVNIGKIINVN